MKDRAQRSKISDAFSDEPHRRRGLVVIDGPDPTVSGVETEPTTPDARIPEP